MSVRNDLRRLQYRLLGPMPVRSHLATIDVIPDDDPPRARPRCLVVYSTDVGSGGPCAACSSERTDSCMGILAHLSHRGYGVSMDDAEVVELSAAEADRLRKRYPSLRDRRRVVAVGVDDDPVAGVVAALESGAMTAVRKPASWEQARRNLAMRRRVLEEFGALTAAELGEWATPGAANPHQYASRLRRANRVFSVPFEGRALFLGFQFDEDGRPLPALAAALASLRKRFGESDWSIASWFSSPNPHLPDKARPVDVLTEDPEVVTAAAQRGARRIAS